MMKKNIQSSLLLLCLLCLTNIAWAQSKVDLGRLRGNTYTNDFFELKIEFPDGWLVGDNVLQAQLLAIQKESIKATNARNQKAVNKATNRLTPLLGGYRSLPGSVAQNSNLKIDVENLPATAKIRTGQQYLERLRSSLKMIRLPAGFSISENKSERIDGKPLDYLEINLGANRKRLYVYIKKGFAVLLTIDSFSKTDFDELHKILSETDLDYKN